MQIRINIIESLMSILANADLCVHKISCNLKKITDFSVNNLYKILNATISSTRA